MLKPADFFDLSDPAVAAFFADLDYVWELLPRLADFVAELTGGKQQIEGEVMAGAYLSDRPIYIGPGAIVEPGAFIQGPAYIAGGATVKHGGFVRGRLRFRLCDPPQHSPGGADAGGRRTACTARA